MKKNYYTLKSVVAKVAEVDYEDWFEQAVLDFETKGTFYLDEMDRLMFRVQSKEYTFKQYLTEFLKLTEHEILINFLKYQLMNAEIDYLNNGTLKQLKSKV